MEDDEQLPIQDSEEYVEVETMEDIKTKDDGMEYEELTSYYIEDGKGNEEEQEQSIEDESLPKTFVDDDQIDERWEPLVLENGDLQCKLCPPKVLFKTKDQFVSHRYRIHGTVSNTMLCPLDNCNLWFASLSSLKKHLILIHHEPVESMTKTFDNDIEFNAWLVAIQNLTNTRFCLFNRQHGLRKKVLYCYRSDHIRSKMSSHKQPCGMKQFHECCPAHITYNTNQETGQIEANYQLLHLGHNENINDESVVEPYIPLEYSECRPLFPAKPKVVGQRPWQFLQLDLINHTPVVNSNGRFTKLLLIVDSFSKFTIAKPIPDTFDMAALLQYICDVFFTFSVPEGISSLHSSGQILSLMEGLSMVFRVDILNVFCYVPDYTPLLEMIDNQAEQELGSKERWPEIVNATIMNHNQSPHQDFQYRVTPYEIFFGRKAYYRTTQMELPWLTPEFLPYDKNDQNSVVNDIYKGDYIPMKSNRKTNVNPSLKDDCGKKLDKKSTFQFNRMITHISERTDDWCETINSETSRKLNNSLPTPILIYEEGDQVFCRNIDRSQNANDYYYKAIIGQVDFETCKCFPYQIFYDNHPYSLHTRRKRNDSISTWPTYEFPSIWVSSVDLAPSSITQYQTRLTKKEYLENNLYCQCEKQSCKRIKNDLCDFNLTQDCCESSGKNCFFHNNYYLSLKKESKKDVISSDVNSTHNIAQQQKNEVNLSRKDECIKEKQASYLEELKSELHGFEIILSELRATNAPQDGIQYINALEDYKNVEAKIESLKIVKNCYISTKRKEPNILSKKRTNVLKY